MTVLARSEIEAYFSRRAIRRLESNMRDHAEPDELDSAIGTEPRKKMLRELARRKLGREYRVVEDGVAIAGAMLESEMPLEIVGLLTRLADEDR